MNEKTTNTIEELIENGANTLLVLMAKRAEEKLAEGISADSVIKTTETIPEVPTETEPTVDTPTAPKPKAKRRTKAQMQAEKDAKAEAYKPAEPTEIEEPVTEHVVEGDLTKDLEEFNEDVTPTADTPSAPKPPVVEEPVVEAPYTYAELSGNGWTDAQIKAEYPTIVIPSADVPTAPKKPVAPKAPAKPEMPR